MILHLSTTFSNNANTYTYAIAQSLENLELPINIYSSDSRDWFSAKAKDVYYTSETARTRRRKSSLEQPKDSETQRVLLRWNMVL